MPDDFKERLARLIEARPKGGRKRAPHGRWTPYAWHVRALVESGMSVMDAVRLVVTEFADQDGIEDVGTAIKSIRQAYYDKRNADWPPEVLKSLKGKLDDDPQSVGGSGFTI